jgi:hypothetical protein
MTNDLWRLLILLAVAVWLAAHDHRLHDHEAIVWDASPKPGETGTVSPRLLGEKGDWQLR